MLCTARTDHQPRTSPAVPDGQLLHPLHKRCCAASRAKPESPCQLGTTQTHISGLALVGRCSMGMNEDGDGDELHGGDCKGRVGHALGPPLTYGYYTSCYKHYITPMIPYLRRMHAGRQASTRPPAKSCQSHNHSKAQCGNGQAPTRRNHDALATADQATNRDKKDTPCWPPALLAVVKRSHVSRWSAFLQTQRGPKPSRQHAKPHNHPVLQATLHARVSCKKQPNSAATHAVKATD